MLRDCRWGDLKGRDHLGEKLFIGSKKVEKYWTTSHELTIVECLLTLTLLAWRIG